MSTDRTPRPLRGLPGRPVASGFDTLPDDEQDRQRERWAECQRHVAPFIEEADRCRGRAAVAAKTAVIA